ncbi:MAG: hypothetical protein HFH65_05365 [Lachnospiraceae bacterium]|nr:hypothetical protein [Lachnospiraceae bacterium]
MEKGFRGIKGGWGPVAQSVMRNQNISPEAKAIYAYLCSFTDENNQCFPVKKMMLKELNMGEKRFYKYMNELKAAGIVEVIKTKNGNVFGHNVYVIQHEVTIRENKVGLTEGENPRRFQNESAENDIELVNSRRFQNDSFQNESFHNNSTNNTSLNNTSINITEGRIDYQEIVNLYNDTCVSFPKALTLSESRKKAIKARLKSYSLEDFKKLFEMAESSRFLKGCNDRNWTANFDWLIKDSNMAKVLEGNYENRTGSKPKQTGTGNIFFDMLQEEEEKEAKSESSVRLW